MEKRKWLWKRKSSERSPGETESSESFSSHSERYSDEQDALRESPRDCTLSPDIMSKVMATDDEMKESVKCLTEKLSAALVNVSAKEDLVKQHAKVAEEAVAGWEKAENEVATLKQQLEAAVQQNLNLEVRASHLDGALKECVRQLRQSKDDQEKRIADAMVGKTCEWESSKSELEKHILELQEEAEAEKSEISASVDLKFDALGKENSSLKQKLVSLCNELEMVTIEKELSIQAAETASKIQLESIKKVAKLKAECKKFQLLARKSNNQKSVVASAFYAESLTDSHSDSEERLNNIETNGSNCLDSWANALIAELDNFKNEKPVNKNLVSAYSVEIDMMDDFLEMERLVALPESKTNTPITVSESASGESVSMDSSMKAEVDSMIQQVAELEKKLEIMEAKKLELGKALDKSEGLIQEERGRVAEAEIKLEELQKELIAVNKAKELLEFQLIGIEVETRTMSANGDSLKVEIEKERKLSAERAIKCQELENELIRTIQESELQQHTNSNSELKLKQEDIAVAADKLAECQKTIASLGLQLESLATLEDFLIDTSNIPGFSKMSRDEIGSHLENGSSDESPSSSSLSTSSANHMTAAKNRNGFGRFFNRSKSLLEPGNHHE